jgi:hypothetical protein
MKKLLFIAVMVLCMALSGAAISFASAGEGYEAAVIRSGGSVSVDAAATGNWKDPYVGMKLKTDSVIKTDAGAFLEIVFDAEGLNVLRIKENTQITVKRAQVELAKGSVVANFPNLAPGTSFSVRTPTAVCGIRGSAMGVDFLNDMTVVMAFEDKVYVKGIDASGNIIEKEVVIPEGWKTQVLQNGNTQPPAELSENELLIFNAWVGQITGTTPGGGTGDDPDPKDLQEVKDKDDDEGDISPSGNDSSSGSENGFSLVSGL